MGTDRENIVPGNLYIMKANVKYRQKAIFSIKKYLPIAALKTLKTRGEVLFL